MSNLRLAWTGSYEDLKNLVGEELKLNGTWQQPGGYKKVFTYNETSISWLKDKKTLTFEGKDSKQFKRMFCSALLGEYIVLNSNQAGVSVEAVTDNSNDKIRSCLCPNYSDEIKDLHSGQLVHGEAIQSLGESVSKINEVLFELKDLVYKTSKYKNIENIPESTVNACRVDDADQRIFMNKLLSTSGNNSIVIDDERVSDKNSNKGTSAWTRFQTIQSMNNQETATDNDSVVLIDLEDPDGSTDMNNLPSGIDNKQNNTGGTVANDSFINHSNPNKPINYADEPVVQDSLTSFDHLLKEKAGLNANMYRRKRNQVHNATTNRTHFSKPNYWRSQNSKPRHHNRFSNKPRNPTFQRRRNTFNRVDRIEDPRHSQTNFPSKNFRSGRHRKIPKSRRTVDNTHTRSSLISPKYRMKSFQSKSELQLEDMESWEAYLQLVNRTLDQFGTLV